MFAFRPFLCTLLLFTMLSVSVPAIAQSASPQAIVFLADNKQFISDWHDLPPGAEPHIKTFKQLVVGKSFTLGLAANVPPAMSGERSFSFGIKLLAPDSTVLINEPSYSTAKGNVPKEGGYMLADPALTLDFNEKDIKGIYHFYIQMTDTQTGTQTYQDYAFTLK